jgi:uncharacterized membrane protein
MKRLVYLSASLTTIVVLLGLLIKPWKHTLVILALCIAFLTILLYLVDLIKNKGQSSESSGPLRRAAFLTVSITIIVMLIGLWFKPWKHTSALLTIALLGLTFLFYFIDLAKKNNKV